MTLGLFIGLVGGLLLLSGSSAVVVESFEFVVIKQKKLKYILAAVLVALSTSLPELFVGLVATISGRQEVALGNLLGANVVNLSLVIGIAVIVGGALSVVGDFMRWEIAAAFLAGSAPILLMLDGLLSRLDGLILLVVYLIYVRDIVIDGKHRTLAEKGAIQKGVVHKSRSLIPKEIEMVYLRLGIGLAGLIAAAELTVRSSVSLAETWKISGGLLGIMIVALGTTLPELFLSIEAIKKKQATLVLGNLLGSVVTNATLVVGLVALINPVTLAKVNNFSVANIFFVLTFGLFWLLTKSKKKIDRWEGLFLVGIYLIFIGTEMLLG